MSATAVIDAFPVDAPVLYVGSTPIGWGPTRDAITFDPGDEWRYPVWNQISTPVAGTGRRIRSAPTIKGKVASVSVMSLGLVMPASTSDGSSGNNVITPYTSRLFLTENDEPSDLLMIQRATDSLMAVWFKKFHVTRWPLTLPDNDEGTFDMELTALLPSTDSPNALPYRIIKPFDFDTFAFAGW